ncbi:MAG: DNA repair protein RecN [Candidatus Omnitrophica bacterium]|nr:DNA repair protein RecN [Candidatus Omnitrophota bacterium]
MLLELQIQNYALIDTLTLEFGAGLNVLTGETGAGKSILIEALRLALGERMDASQVRHPDKSCLIQAIFTLEPEVRAKDIRFNDFAPQQDDYLVFKREISAEGRSKSYINGQFINLTVLRDLGNLLINIHSQHDHQQILDSSQHGRMLDRMARAGTNRKSFVKAEETYQGFYSRYRELADSRDRLARDQAQKERELDLLRFQVDEIGRVKPQKEEWISLSEEKIRLSHAEKLSALMAALLTELDEDELSASARIAKAFRSLGEWQRIDPAASEAVEKLTLAQEQLTELIRLIQDYRDNLSFDDGRLSELETRLDQLDRLLKKYGDIAKPHSLEPVIEFHRKAQERLDYLESSETLAADMTREIEGILPSLEKAAAELTKLRKETGEALSKSLIKELAELGIKQSRFSCDVCPADFGLTGRDTVEFRLSANPGQPLAPLGAVASGGEAARVMLALKKTLAHADDIPALIFDEIDANIGGRLGAVIGEKIAAISRHRQVLLITHLPQIASFADRHIKVVKKASAKGQTTTVDYQVLEGDARVRELAQMMSGEQETKISKSHAEEMLRTAGKKV